MSRSIAAALGGPGSATRGQTGRTGRAVLLTGVSLTALLAAGLPAAAAPPPLFSPAWFAGRANGAAAGAALANAGSALTANSLRQAAQTTANLAAMAARLKAAQATQSIAAQAAATRPGAVPNGLVAGGLQPAPGIGADPTLWSGAALPTQTVAAGRTKVTVTQWKPQAILTWQSFNVGASTTLSFDQSQGGAAASSWVALNRVQDPSGKPSQILGAVTAPGRVYVINRNGIIFGAGSQVNVGALIASTADFGATVAVANAQFSTNGIYNAANATGFTPVFSNAPAKSAVSVEAGATIASTPPQAVTEGGGSVLLLARSVSNAGAISTPQGQTVLAAGTSFYLRPGYSTTGNTTSTTRGSEVAVAGGGTVANTGLIQSALGDVTLVGHAVNQAGVVLATTSVNVRGTVHLLTDLTDLGGRVTLAPGSLTAVQPDGNGDTALDSQRAALISQSASINAQRALLSPGQVLNDVALTVPDRLDRSRIEISSGGSVEFGAGSLAMTQGGQVAVSAGQSPVVNGAVVPNQRSRILIDGGAAIDVSGSTTTLPMAANNVLVNIQPFQLRDAPANRDTRTLASSNVTIDIRNLTLVAGGSQTGYPSDRYYTAGGLLEVSGFLNNAGHGIGEWTAQGGSVTLSGNAVVAQPGASFNLSGGAIQYQSGHIRTSYLIGTDGRLYDVSTAPANISYAGLYNGFTETHPKWNVSSTYQSSVLAPTSRYEDGYTVGRDGGSLTLSTPTVIFEGTINAGVIDGARQKAARPASVTDSYALPQNTVPLAGTLALGQYGALGLVGLYPTTVNILADPAPAAAGVVRSGALPGSLLGTANLAAGALDAAELGGLSVATSKPVSVTAPLTLADGGKLSITAPLVSVSAALTARGGSIAISNAASLVQVSGAVVVQPLAQPNGNAGIAVAATTIDTHGVWTNVPLDPTNLAGLAVVNGGTVSLDSAQSLTLATGSVIDVASGGAVLADHSNLGGKGGSVTLTGNNPAYQSKRRGQVSLGAALRGYGTSGGGTLTLSVPQVLIGPLGTMPSTLAQQLLLTPDFFTQGFTSYVVNGVSGLGVVAGTQVQASVPVYNFTAASPAAPSGSDPASALALYLPPLYLEDPLKAVLTRRVGASLSLQSSVNPGSAGAKGGNLTVGAGAAVGVDPGQSIQLQAYGQITVSGTLSAPGGRIAIANTRVEDSSFAIAPSFRPGLSIYLDAGSRLDVAARAATALDRYGRQYGTVPAGGTVGLGGVELTGAARLDSSKALISTNAQIIERPGAVIDAGGTSAVIDQLAGLVPRLNALSPGASSAPVLATSGGGGISASSYTGIFLEGTLSAAAGGPGAAGGTLALTLENPVYSVGNKLPPVPNYLRAPRTIKVSQDEATLLPAGLRPGQATPVGLFATAPISAAQVSEGGFDTVSLFARDLIAFQGSVDLQAGQSITLSQGIIADSAATGSVRIAAPYVLISGETGLSASQGISYTINQDNGWRPAALPSHATLAVEAALIDLQNTIRFGFKGTIPFLRPNGSSVQTPLTVRGFGSIALASTGDVRFLPNTTLSSNPSAKTTLVTPGNLAFSAAQIYPVTGATAEVYAGVNYYAQPRANPFFAGGTISIAGIPGSIPAPPDSAGGSLTLAAGTVLQGGVVRAPEGSITLGVSEAASSIGLPVPDSARFYTYTVTLAPGSITSVSAAGQSIPYGGTADGVSYSYAGQAVNAASALNPQITLLSQSTTVQAGATLDLGGGGTLAGAAFISGRGGSVDTLQNPLLAFNPAAQSATVHTLASNPVYAILPGAQLSYAPTTRLENVGGYTGSVPQIGQQITLTTGVPGLPAGTYTLLPSYYALQPGGYRIELDPGTRLITAGATPLGNGSYSVYGYQGISNTAVRNAQPVAVTLTPGSAVRSYSQYNEQSYSAFLTTSAALFGYPRPALPADGKTLNLIYPSTPGSGPALTFAGTGRFAAAPGGYGGTATVQGASTGNQPSIEIVADAAAHTAGYVSIVASDLNAIGAARLVIGGGTSITTNVNTGIPVVQFNATANGVTVRDGAVLGAPEVFLVSDSLGGGSTVKTKGAITIESGASINTLGYGAPGYDSNSGYYYYANGNSVLAVSNGRLVFVPTNSFTGDFSAPITIAAGAALYSNGTLSFSTTQGLSLSSQAGYGGRFLDFSVSWLNLGSDAALAAAVVPPGFTLTQPVFARLLAGDPAVGAPAVQELRFTASQSINLLGSVAFSTIDPATGQSSLQQLVLETPAVYGYGGAGDVARLTTGSVIWNGIAANVPAGGFTQLGSALPGGVIAGGPGTGHGTLDITASQIVFGYPSNSRADNQITLNRTILGFATVNLTGTQQISANNKGSLAVYETAGPSPGAAGTGGALNLITPLLTGQPGSVDAITAGGALRIGGVAPSTAIPLSQGAEIDLTAASIDSSGAIVLSGGRLTMTARGAIALDAGARLDLAGQPASFFDQVRYSPGGAILLESATGSITAAAGSTIDVSSPGAAAGSLSATATTGTVSFAGAIRGGAPSGYAGGAFTTRAGRLADFAGLNATLNAGGVFGARSFDIKTGDLTIGNEVQASTVSISLDAGSLTVDGTILASGARPGSISLAASGDLTLAAGSRLDAHATVLHTDSYGVPIDAQNTPSVTLSSSAGTLRLDAGAAIDVGAADGVARGKVALNAPRTGGNDIAIVAPSGIAINGVASVAVYGFRSYTPADGKIIQSDVLGTLPDPNAVDLVAVNADSRAFINAALGNAGLQTRLGGLRQYGAAFHLRPGVQITGPGDLTIQGDLNLAEFRYGPGASATTGAGEPGSLVIRAGGNLNIYGSVTDGFAAPLDNVPNKQGRLVRNPDDNGWLLFSTDPYNANVVVPTNTVMLGAFTTFPTGNVALNYDVTLAGTTLNANAVIPTLVTLSLPAKIASAGFVATADIVDAGGVVQFRAGQIVPGGTVLQTGWTLGANSVVPVPISISRVLWRAGWNFNLFSSPSVTLASRVTLPVGGLIPAGTAAVLLNADPITGAFNLRPQAGGGQGSVYAIGAMLPAGSQSWSMGLVAGADLAAADPLMLKPTTSLGGSGNLRLSDLHYTVAAGNVSYSVTPSFSVIRSGTGNLNLLAGGDFIEYSPYGIYTAGAQTATAAAYNLTRGLQFNGTPLGPPSAYFGTTDYNLFISNYSAYYAKGGGNVLLSTQGGVFGDVISASSNGLPNSDWIGNWLWRQGGFAGQATAWWLNFGTYVYGGFGPNLVGFVGVGALGGGNVTVLAGGNAGETTTNLGSGTNYRSQGLDLAVATTGQVQPATGGAGSGGTLLQYGGGDLTVRVGGALNGNPVVNAYSGLAGTFTDLRGQISIDAGSIGQVVYTYGQAVTSDPRPANPFVATQATSAGGILVVPGDATVDVHTLGDLVLGGAGDATRLAQQNQTNVVFGSSTGRSVTAYSTGITSFSLWTDRSAISLFSAGGNVTPSTQPTDQDFIGPSNNNAQATDYRFEYPPTLKVVAASGSIFYGSSYANNASLPQSQGFSLELAPSPVGQLELLAAGSIRAGGAIIDISGAKSGIGNIPNPFAPAYSATYFNGVRTLVQTNVVNTAYLPYSLFALEADTATGNLHANDRQPALIYAATGDITDFHLGEVLNFPLQDNLTPSTWYIAAKPAWIRAGRDIVASGIRPGSAPSNLASGVLQTYPNLLQSAQSIAPGSSGIQPAPAQTSGSLLLNNTATQVSLLSAGRDVIESYAYIAGPGLLEVDAGRNLYQANNGLLRSIGPIFDISATTRNGGAGISVLAGLGAAGPDYAGLATLYLNPANQLAAGQPLTAGDGQVALTYQDRLLAWLQQTYGYAGDPAAALGYFQALPALQQDVFLRQVFYAELLASGREETNPNSPRFKSYLRGRQAIATLFPAQDAAGQPISYGGGVTMFSGTLSTAGGVIQDQTGTPVTFDAGISTQFGGDIQVLAPGGAVTLGLASSTPGANTGLVTFGSGSIDAYTLGSVLLGQSRVFTTFGGNIQIWSAEGDINAGIGAKTTVVYQPPRIAYDNYGGLTLSPTVPSNGAGIATLNPIPGVPAGDVDLVAPLGTIDAGEAGIRVSGNLNLAALTVVNAANIAVQGKTSGLPVVAVPSLGAVEAAAAAAGAAQNAAQNSAEDRRKRQLQQPSVITVEVIGYGG